MKQNISKAVRQFGLAHCDFPTMMSNISFFLRALSLNVDPRNQNPIPLLNIILGIAFVASYCYVYIISMIWFVFWRCMETGNMLHALIIFSLGAASQMGPYKIIFMFAYKDKLRRLVEKCLIILPSAESETRFFTNQLKALKDVKKRAMIFWFVIMSLEPVFETPNYQIAFLLSALGIFVTVYLPSNATAFQIVIGGYIESQMLAWCEELILLWEDAENHYSKLIHSNFIDKERDIVINEFVNHSLKYIMKAHAAILIILSEMEEVFSGALAVELGLLLVCLIAELLGGLQNTYMEVPFALMQVGMDCFIGQRLEDASLMFLNAVYSCKWENFSKDNMKVVMMMMMVSQKKMTLSAGGLVKLNYLTFISIIKMIYSTYTALSATMR